MTTPNNKQSQHPKFLLYTSIAGTVSGIVTKFLVHPLDTLKNKLQVINSIFIEHISDLLIINQVSRQKIDMKNITNHFLKEMTEQTWKKEGIRGFYKGVGISAHFQINNDDQISLEKINLQQQVGSAPAFSLFMTGYEYTKKQLSEIPFFEGKNFLKYMICGFTAELVSCVLWLPIDVIKQRQQVQANLGLYNYKNSVDAAQQIIRKEGFFALYRGFGATLISFGSSVALYFAFYEKLKEIYVKDPKNIGFWQSLILAAIGGSFSGFLCNPLFMSKLRMQVQLNNVSSSFGYKNVFHGVALIYRNEGFYAFFKGMVPKLIMNTPQKALSMSITEVVRKNLIYLDESLTKQH